MSKKNKQQSGLGKALRNKIQKKKFQSMGDRAPIFYQETQQNQAEKKKAKLKSIVNQNSLEGFLQIAQISQQDFHANRDIKFREIREQMRNKKIITNKQKRQFEVQEMVDQHLLHKIQLPRRPDWKNLTKQQLQKKQAQNYIRWRRSLAQIQQKNSQIQITPYQKNIEVWKQLWRVVDRADLIIQIVDGRDPLFYRSQDLVQYVKEINETKQSLLLVNKSDLVNEEKIQMWNEYFIKNKINHVFFSAKQEIQQLNHQNLAEGEENIIQDNVSETTEESKANRNVMDFVNTGRVLSVTELIQLMELYTTELKKEKIQIGLVGYPNVGKSSVINSVFGKKKVAVASLPGKTKHFQTLPLTQAVTLCDCPGLVFPRISSSYAQMVLNGLFPIDTIKNYNDSMEILALRISKKQINQTYSISWKQDQIYDGDSIVEKYAKLKGFYTGSGLPNKSIAARNILKNYVNGVLKYAKHPPGYEVKTHNDVQESIQNSNNALQKEQFKHIEDINMKKKQNLVEKQLDGEFFGGETKQVEISVQEAVRQLTEDDMLDIVQGRKIPNVPVTKEMRKQIKFALKRGQNLESIKKKVFFVTSKDKHKTFVKV